MEIANFELIPSGEINDQVFYFPEEEPFSLNFSECGIDSQYFLLIMGFPIYIMLGYFSLLMLYIILALTNRLLKCKCLGKVVDYLGSYLFWNGYIRLYMELYKGLCLASVLNTYTADDDMNSPF